MQVSEIKDVFIPIAQKIITQHNIVGDQSWVVEGCLAILLQRLGFLDAVLIKVQKAFYGMQCGYVTPKDKWGRKSCIQQSEFLEVDMDWESIGESEQLMQQTKTCENFGWDLNTKALLDLMSLSDEDLIDILLDNIHDSWLNQFFGRHSLVRDYHDLEVARIMGHPSNQDHETPTSPLYMLRMQQADQNPNAGSSHYQFTTMYQQLRPGMCLMDFYVPMKRARSEFVVGDGDDEEELDDSMSILSDSRLYYYN